MINNFDIRYKQDKILLSNVSLFIAEGRFSWSEGFVNQRPITQAILLWNLSLKIHYTF